MTWLVEIRPFPLAAVSADNEFAALDGYLSMFKLSSKRLRFHNAAVDYAEKIIRAA